VLEVDEIDRLGDEVEGAAVHRGAQIGHVAIGRDDDRTHLVAVLAQPRENRQTVHHRHVDVAQYQIDVRLGGQHLERFLAVPGEAESKLALANLLAEAMCQQQLEIGLVVNGEDFRRRHCYDRTSGRRPSCAFSTSKSTGLVMNSLAPNSTARRRRSSSP
jgi:hypothetical protein